MTDQIIKATLPDGFQVFCDLATTEEEKQKGLAGVPSLAPNRGMLFVWDMLDHRPFWMCGCLMPLDVIWISPDGPTMRVVELAQNRKPDPMGNDFLFGGSVRSQYVLEIGSGLASRHGVILGSEVKW